jgi:hypothetical protein
LPSGALESCSEISAGEGGTGGKNDQITIYHGEPKKLDDLRIFLMGGLVISEFRDNSLSEFNLNRSEYSNERCLPRLY